MAIVIQSWIILLPVVTAKGIPGVRNSTDPSTTVLQAPPARFAAPQFPSAIHFSYQPRRASLPRNSFTTTKLWMSVFFNDLWFLCRWLGVHSQYNNNIHIIIYIGIIVPPELWHVQSLSEIVIQLLNSIINWIIFIKVSSKPCDHFTICPFWWIWLCHFLKIRDGPLKSPLPTQAWETGLFFPLFTLQRNPSISHRPGPTSVVEYLWLRKGF